MGGKSSSPPPAPNYALAAEMSAEASKEAIEQQTWANRPSQISPWGSTEWTTTPVWDPTTQSYINQWTQQTRLDPLLGAWSNRDLESGQLEAGKQGGALYYEMLQQQQRSKLASELAQKQGEIGANLNDWEEFDSLAQPYARASDMNYENFAFNTPGGNAPILAYNESLYNDLPQRQQYANEAKGMLAYNDELYSQLPQAQQYANQARSAQSRIAGTSEQLRRRAEDAMYSKAESRLNPQWENEQSDLESRLAAQGLRPGDAAYDRAIDQFYRNKTDAYNQATWSATEAGRAEAQQLFGQEMNRAELFNQAQNQIFGQEQAANQAQQGLRGMMFGEQLQGLDQYNQAQQMRFAQEQTANAAQQGVRSDMFREQLAGLDQYNQAQAQLQQLELARQGGNLQNQIALGSFQNQIRANQMAEYLQRQGADINTIQALMTNNQVQMPNMPGFQAAAAYQPADYMGAAQAQYGASLDAYNAQQAGQQGMMSGLAGLAGTGLQFAMMSDRRLKRNVKRIGEYLGYPWYLFQYVWGEWAVGVMADEVNQDAVGYTPAGYAYVDYSRIK